MLSHVVAISTAIPRNPLAVATRRQQLRSALRRLRRLGLGATEATTATVLAGDFNELAGSALHGELQSGRLEDQPESWKFLDACENASP